MPRNPLPPKPALSARSMKEADDEWKRQQRARGRKLDRHGRILPADPKADQPMRSFWDNIDLHTMHQALAESGDDRLSGLASALMDPRLRKSSISRLCRDHGVTLQQLNDLWRKHNLALGMIQAATHLPKVLDDVAQDAESRFEVCPRCDGTATITRTTRTLSEDGSERFHDVESQCPRCKGAREVRVPGDAKARDLVFETFGLTGKSGPLFAQQINIGTDETLEGTLTFAQRLIQSPNTTKGDS